MCESDFLSEPCAYGDTYCKPVACADPDCDFIAHAHPTPGADVHADTESRPAARFDD